MDQVVNRLENQLLQLCGSDSIQSNDTTEQQESLKGAGDNSALYYLNNSSYYPFQQAGEYAPRLESHAQWGSVDGTSSKSPNREFFNQFTMSGGPPQHPHGRQGPPNSAWNHLQVPNYYSSRQPQHAHMSNDLSLLPTHQPTWHTPTTTEPTKVLHSPLFNLQQMLGTERSFTRHSPGVDLSLTRNGSQNGDLPQTPISLSVRDTKQINSLPVGAALDVDRAVELTKGPSPGLGSECQPSPKGIRRPAKRMDSIIDRLNITSEKQPHSVIVTATSSSHDENSNSSQGTAIASIPTPTPAPIRDDEVASPISNEDSLDSNKSRRKRKPSKTIKVPKEDENEKLTPIIESSTIPIIEPSSHPETNTASVTIDSKIEERSQSPARRRSSSEPSTSPVPSSKSRRKTLSESETIDNIAAMVAATSKETDTKLPETVKPILEQQLTNTHLSPTPVIPDNAPEENIPVAKPVSVIKRDQAPHNTEPISLALPQKTNVEETTQQQCGSDSQVNDKENSLEAAPVSTLITPAQKKAGDSQCFVAVEDELEKMFAGIADTESNVQSNTNSIEAASTAHNVNDSVNSVVSDVGESPTNKTHKRGRPKGSKNSSRRTSESSEATPKKKHKANKRHTESFDESLNKSTPKKQSSSKTKKNKKSSRNEIVENKVEAVKDVYSYDSGSNASSNKSKGPFLHIKGPRDSPISVNIINTPNIEDDPEKAAKQLKNKKFHDETEYIHKVRSKGLHCSTLSNKYDAQTRDPSWICVFCKRGPHATDPLLPGPSPFSLDIPQYSPGDLFGPYVISTDSSEYQRRLDDPFDAQYKSKRATTAFNSSLDTVKSFGKKSKKRLSESNRDSIDSSELNKDIMFGVAEAGPNSYEIWLHEDCVIWCPGVYLVGPKIVGLEGAVWVACSVVCKRCGLRGAAVCCLKRGCGNVMHIGCAKLSNWKLDENTYKAYCSEHSHLHIATENVP